MIDPVSVFGKSVIGHSSEAIHKSCLDGSALPAGRDAKRVAIFQETLHTFQQI